VKFVARAWERRGAIAWAGCAVALAMAAVGQFPEVLLAARLHVPVSLKNLFGWRELGAAISHASAQTDLTVADRMQDAAELQFYMPGRPEVWFYRPPGRRPSAFDFFDRPPDIPKARRVLFIGNHAEAFCQAYGFRIISSGLWTYHFGGRTADRTRSYWLLERRDGG